MENQGREDKKAAEGEPLPKSKQTGIAKAPNRVLPPPLRDEATSSATPAQEAKGGGKGRKGGGRGRRNQDSIYQPSLDETLQAVGELTLETRQTVREMQGYLERTALIPADCKPVEKALARGQKFAKLRQESKGKNLGSGHIPIGLDFLKTIPEDPSLAGNAALMEALDKFWQEVVMKCNQEELAFHLQVFRVNKPKHANSSIMGGGYARISFRFAPASPGQQHAARLEETLVAAFKELGWDVKYGTPPKSKKEMVVADIFRN